MNLLYIRCQCNGHAPYCVEGTGEEAGVPTTNMVCLCQHGTDGPNCETCLPDHWDRPWRRATSQNANECKRKFPLKKILLYRIEYFQIEVIFDSNQSEVI